MQIDEFGSISEHALQRFVYIVGTVRGGTSILRDSLGVHDELLVLPGLTYFMNNIWHYRNKIHQRLLKVIYRKPNFYDPKKVLSSLDEDRSRALRKHLQNTFNKKELASWWQNYPLIWGLDPDNKKNPAKVKAWVDKVNDLYGLGEIPRAMPKAKFLFITRDPRASILSMTKRYRTTNLQDDSIINKHDLVPHCIHWRNMTQRMLTFTKRYPERSYIFKFEDFLTAPEQTLNIIFDFLEVKNYESLELSSRLATLNYRATNDPSDRGHGITTKPLHRWKKALSQDHQNFIETLTGATARKAGYDIQNKRAPLSAVKVMPGVKAKGVAAAKLAYLEAKERFV